MAVKLVGYRGTVCKEEISSCGGVGLARIADAQAFLQVSRTTVYLLMDSGELAYVKLGRNRRIPWASLCGLVERLSRTDGRAVSRPVGTGGSAGLDCPIEASNKQGVPQRKTMRAGGRNRQRRGGGAAGMATRRPPSFLRS